MSAGSFDSNYASPYNESDENKQRFNLYMKFNELDVAPSCRSDEVNYYSRNSSWGKLADLIVKKYCSKTLTRLCDRVKKYSTTKARRRALS